MAQYENNASISLIPVSTAVIRKARFLAVVTAGEVQEAGAAGDSVGVSAEASANPSSVAIPVVTLNSGKIGVEAGAAITAGVRVMSDSQGRAITATGATARVLGYALTASAAAGEIITFLAKPSSGEFVS